MIKYIRLLAVIGCISIIFYVAYNTVFVHNPGTVIFLTGTASSGKSSVYQALRKQLDPAQYQFFNQDEFEETEIAKKGGPLSPEEEKEADRRFFQAIAKASKDGKQVIVDVVMQIPENPYDPKYSNHPATSLLKNALTILLYCPLDEIVRRTQQRNLSGIAAEQREAYFSFRQFLGFYKLQDATDERVVDTLATEPLKQLLHATIDDLLARLPPEEASEAPGIQQFEQEFVQHYKLDTLAEITIVPVYGYDMVINTSLYTTQQIVEQVKMVLPLS